MWETIIEWCADLFGVTVHSRLGQLVVFVAGIFLVGVLLAARWGYGSLIVPVGLLGLSVAAARQVSRARDELWRAACLDLGDPEQRPPERPKLQAPTAAALTGLAAAVDLVRRTRYAAAGEIVPQIQRDLLRAEEVQLLDAVRAMISLGLGEPSRAASQAAAALPTGSADLDACLGRMLVADAWHNLARLGAIHAAWQRTGVKDGPISRLSTLMRLRFDERELEHVPQDLVRDLAEDARAVGDDALASELEIRARANAYR